jgi:D-amino-acid dehydrogenase
MGPVKIGFGRLGPCLLVEAALGHVAIIGAGITGVTTAYSLLERGHEVTLFEQRRYAAMETSYANGGQLSASNAEVWNHPANLIKALRWIFRSTAPLQLNLRPSWHKYSWLGEFVGQLPYYKINTIETVRLALQARRQLFAIAERENIDFDLERRGILHFYRDRRGFDHASAVNLLLQQGGLERYPVTPEEMNAIEPAVHGTFYGGFFTPSDATGDIHKFTRQLTRACVRRGMNQHFETFVDGAAPRGGRFALKWRACDDYDTPSTTEETIVDAVVICAGVASRRFGAMLGDRVNVYPVKGYSITIELLDDDSQLAAPRVGLLDDDTKIVSSRLGVDRFRVAGTAEFNGYNLDVRDIRVSPLIAWTRKLFPSVSTERIISWAGLRPMMPSMLPHVGVGRRPGVFYNTGHGHLGWTLSAATAAILTDVVEEYLDSMIGSKL